MKRKSPLPLTRAKSGAYLIIGDNSSFQKWTKEAFLNWEFPFKNNPDLINLQQEKVGIGEIRLLRKFLSRKEWGKRGKKVILIPNSKALSHEAQSALLKTLEELKMGRFIFIGTISTANMMPTIISRCQIIHPFPRLAPSNQPPIDLASLKKLTVAQRLIYEKKQIKLGKLTTSQMSKKLRLAITFYQKQLVNSKQIKTTSALKHQLIICCQALRMLEANLKPISVVDWLLINL